MTQHDDIEALHHMMNHAREAIDLAHGHTREDFESDRVLVLALTRLVEIVGEASTRISNEFKDRHPHIPWQLIRGMRNRLIHEYDATDTKVLWDTITQDLPPLLRQIEPLIDK